MAKKIGSNCPHLKSVYKHQWLVNKSNTNLEVSKKIFSSGVAHYYIQRWLLKWSICYKTDGIEVPSASWQHYTHKQDLYHPILCQYDLVLYLSVKWCKKMPKHIKAIHTNATLLAAQIWSYLFVSSFKIISIFIYIQLAVLVCTHILYRVSTDGDTCHAQHILQEGQLYSSVFKLRVIIHSMCMSHTIA